MVCSINELKFGRFVVLPFVLKEAAGWSSLVMPRRYVEKGAIANEQMEPGWPIFKKQTPDKLALVRHPSFRRGELEKALDTFEDCHRVSCMQNLIKSPVTTRYRNGLLEAFLVAAEQFDVPEHGEWLKKAGLASKDALQQGKTYPPGMPEAMMLRGRYDWLVGQHATAQDWWQRSLAMAEDMNMRYDQGRIRMEMGQRTNERLHLERAAAIFTEISSAWELTRVGEIVDQNQFDANQERTTPKL